MNKQRAAKLYELADRLSKLDVNTLSEQQRQQRNKMISKLQEEVKTIKEFSPSEDGSENEELFNYAKLWYNGDMSTQEDVEKALDLIGWEIGEVETEEGGAFIIKSGDENGNTYTSFTPEDLSDSETMSEEFNGEYDDEAGMVQSNLRTMARAVNGLLDIIEDNDNLPEWAQEKIAKAEMMTTSVWDYLLSQKEQGMDPKVSEDVTEDNDHSLKKVWDRYSKHLMASRGDHPDVAQIHKSGEITRKIRKYVRDHHGQKAVDDMERYADKRQWSEGIAETKKPSPKLTPVNIKKTDTVSEEINKEAYERLQKVFAFKNYES